MNKKKIEELEEFENLVKDYVAPYYFKYPTINWEIEKFIDNKVLYYLKLGLTSTDMKIKIEEKNKNDTFR